MSCQCAVCYATIAQPDSLWYAAAREKVLTSFVCGSCLSKIPLDDCRPTDAQRAFDATFGPMRADVNASGVYQLSGSRMMTPRFWVTADVLESAFPSDCDFMADFHPFHRMECCLLEIIQAEKDKVWPPWPWERRSRDQFLMDMGSAIRHFLALPSAPIVEDNPIYSLKGEPLPVPSGQLRLVNTLWDLILDWGNHREAEQQRPTYKRVEAAFLKSPANPLQKPFPPQLRSIKGIRHCDDIFELETTSIHADPPRFAYKIQNFSTGEIGIDPVTGAAGFLDGVEVWNDLAAGVLDVWWDPVDRLFYVIDGHTRLAKAKELGVPQVAVHILKVETDKIARTYGAEINIGRGKGTSLDAASWLRAMGIGRVEFYADGTQAHYPFVEEALVLAGIPESEFLAVLKNPTCQNLTSKIKP